MEVDARLLRPQCAILFPSMASWYVPYQRGGSLLMRGLTMTR